MEKLLEELRLIRQAVERLTVDDTRTPVDDTRTTIQVWRDERGWWNAETETKFGVYRATEIWFQEAIAKLLSMTNIDTSPRPPAPVDTLDRKA